MGKVSVFKSMSLDGFIAGPNDEIDPLHDWLFVKSPEDGGKGKWNETAGNGKPEKFFGPEATNRQILDEGFARMGSILVGRRTYEAAKAWGGNPPGGAPTVVLTHNPPPPSDVTKAFTYVDGFEEGLKEARAATPSGNVGLMGAEVTQQAIEAGMLEEIVIAVIPVLLGRGIQLFGEIDHHVTLKRTRVVPGENGVTHLFFDVVR
jgi:dihydrofolate reductase